MALQAPTDREFAVLPRGYIRDRVVLANFREGLRSLVNPETGNPFTEDEIQRATQPRSRWYVAAQAIDDYGQAEQRKAIWLADQIRLERASSEWLRNFHGRLWGEEPLPATGGSGEVIVSGVPQTIVVGSTTIGAPTAYTARDARGNVYQVFVTELISGNGTVTVTMVGVSTGSSTNLRAGETLTWITRDPNMAATATVASDFTGGTDVETDAELASRLAGIIRHRPGGGNDAHVRAWARAASNAIEDGFVYPCAFHAGSTLVAITQKRTAGGPTVRKPNDATLAAAIAYLTPPGSPVFPPRAFVVVTGWNEQYSDFVLRLGMAKGSVNGFLDPQPFPRYHVDTPTVVQRTSDVEFRIRCPGDAALPGQPPGGIITDPSRAPKMMLWDRATSRFATLSVAQIDDLGAANEFSVRLTAPPQFANGDSMTVAVGQVVSPAMQSARHEIVSKAIEAYFDELGPGDLFDMQTDPRGGRCVRFPRADEERPFRAGAVVATRVIEALGGSAADGVLASMSVTTPSFPTNLMQGPNMVVPGHVGVYEL